MTVGIALLRGINVGGSGKLPMAELRAIMEKLGARAIETYIQSGNAVYEGVITSYSIHYTKLYDARHDTSRVDLQA